MATETTAPQAHQPILESIEATWQAAIRAGQKIEINRSMSTVSIVRGEDDEYFFQGHEADELIDTNENSWLAQFFSLEVILLWQAQGW